MVHEPTGRVLEVFTDQPGVQLYTGNGLDDSVVGKNGIKYKKYFGFALEAQNYPNAVNQVDICCGDFFMAIRIYLVL